jgi:hypothetical protein
MCRVRQLQRFKQADITVPLPELLQRVDPMIVQQWTCDENVLFDLVSSDKWTKITLDMHGGDLKKAIRSRFEEKVADAAAQEQFNLFVDLEFAGATQEMKQKMKEMVPTRLAQQIDDGFAAARLLNELNELFIVIEPHVRKQDTG